MAWTSHLTLKLLRDSIPNVHLQIVGEGPHGAHLKDRVSAENLGGSVDFVGIVPIEAIPSILAASHCGICPVTGQLWNVLSFPNKIYEYIASGLPTVIPRTQLLATYYPEESVLFYEPDNAADLAAKILEVYQGGEDLRRRLRLAREDVLKRLNWQTQERALLDCVHLMIGAPP